MANHKYKLLIVSLHKSGSHSVAAWLRDVGLRMKHQQLGVDGCISNYYYINPPHGWLGHDDIASRPNHFTDGKTPDVFNLKMFKVRAHMTRHPFKVVCSIANLSGATMGPWMARNGVGPGWLADVKGTDRLLQSMGVVYYANLKMHSVMPLHFQMENAQTILPSLLSYFQFVPRRPYSDVIMPHYHSAEVEGVRRKYHNLGFDDFKSLDVKLADSLARMTERYGYAVY